MTIAIEDDAPAAREHDRRRRRLIVAGVAALVLLTGGLVTGFTLLHLDHQYGPLQGGSFGGLYSDGGFAFSKDGFTYHLAEAPAATGQLIGSLDNRGAHSVKITSIETGDIVTQIRWSVYRVVNGGSVEGVATPWRAFPAIVPAYGTIRLLITIHHASNCGQYPRYHGVSDARYDGAHLVHWESLLHDHTTLVPIYQTGDDIGIRVC